MDKKGISYSLNLGASGILLIILLIVIAFFAWLAYLSYLEYEKEYGNGELILDNLTMLTQNPPLSKGLNEGEISVLINGSKIRGGFDINIVYLAKKFDGSEEIPINTDNSHYSNVEVPFLFPNVSVSMVEYFDELGSGLEVCANSEVIYKSLNWWGTILNYPTRSLENCTSYDFLPSK